MNMKKLLLLAFVIGLSLNAFSQKKSLEDNYENYFKNTREVPFLHLNKTSFLKGEEIWLQAYVLEQNSKKLHPTTSNLYVGLFNDKGELKQQKLVHIKQGLGQASIEVDSSFTGSKYYIKASTNWMRNFDEDNSYVQEIKVIQKRRKTTKMVDEKSFFDFQVFPEGGHLLAGINNTLGVLIKDKNGKGVKADKIALKNSNGDVVKEFSSNFLGIGKVSFNHTKGEKYTLEATLANGSKVSKVVPAAENRGVTLNVINPSASFVSVNLTTNPETLPQLVGKKYTILIHNTNFYYRNEIEFQPRNNTYTLVLSNKKLAKGMNIVTVFDENNQPISERLFFNYDKDIFANTTVSSKVTPFDSLATTFANTADEKLYLSASFLPSETKAYNPDNNIYSNFLLKPYIKGDIENAAYYFADTDRKKLNNLDLLLLTQGWSKYNWNNIFDSAPNTNFDFENGISVTGVLNKPLRKGNKILLVSEENNIVRDIQIENQKFTLENAFLKENSNLSFAVNYGDNLYEVQPVLQYSANYPSRRLDSKYFSKSDKSELEVSNFGQLSKGREILDEIRLKAAKKREYKNSPYGSITMMTGYRMKDRIIMPAETVVDFLIAKRFPVSRSAGDLIIGPRTLSSTNSGRGVLDDRSTTDIGDGKNPNPVIRIYLNDMDISMSQWQLENIFLNNVEEIFIGRIPKGFNENEQIYIYTQEFDEIASKANKFGKVVVNYGFSKEKSYYQPNYPSYRNETYINYGAVSWKPSVVVNANSTTTFNIPKNMQKNISVFVEGITESGKLVSKRIEIKN